MKRLKPFLLVAAMLGVWLTAFSDSWSYYDPYGGYTPYFMERADLERSVGYLATEREMKDPGKLWVSGDNNTIYVVERYKGVHIVNNSNPAKPQQAGFITAPGCIDIAIKGDVIYLDNAVDLVAFSLTSHTELERLVNFFPEPLSPNGISYSRYNYPRPDNMILVGWKKR
jgi:hypothetical protein